MKTLLKNLAKVFACLFTGFIVFGSTGALIQDGAPELGVWGWLVMPVGLALPIMLIVVNACWFMPGEEE